MTSHLPVVCASGGVTSRLPLSSPTRRVPSFQRPVSPGDKLRASRLLQLVPRLDLGHLESDAGLKGCSTAALSQAEASSERQVLCGRRRLGRKRMTLKICCIKLSLAARIIAMVGLIAAVLVLTQLSTELAEPDKEGGTVSILLGLDVDDFRDTSTNGTRSSGSLDIQGLEVFIAFLIFSFIYATASAILIWGSIVERSCFAFPWLFCEAVSFVTQILTLTIHFLNLDEKKDKWIILLCIFNLLISIYFWVVVFCAARSWSLQSKQERQENASTSTLSSGNETMNDEPFERIIPPGSVQV